MFPVYTTTLKSLVVNGFDLGLRDYPIWDEAHRSVLNNKIINHYLVREIGAETPELFRLYLNRTMDEIMPYYNKLYETTVYSYNPIANVKYTEHHDIERTNDVDEKRVDNVKGTAGTTGNNTVDYTGTTNSSNENTANVNGKNVDIDTPQSALGINNIDSVEYASNIKFNKDGTVQKGSATDSQTTKTSSVDESKTTTDTTTTGTNNLDEKEVRKGIKSVEGTYGSTTIQRMIEQERSLIVNIDMMIIEELNSCFMNLW